MKLIFPEEKYKNEIWEYRKEFINNNDSIDGSSFLAEEENFENWLKNCRQALNEETVKDGYVPSTQFIAVENERVVGMCSVRHRLNDFLKNYGGHIGYSVRPSERRKGYATKILKSALNEAGKLGIEKVLVTCDEDNEGSKKTILNNNGVFENKVEKDGRITCRYWINIDL